MAFKWNRAGVAFAVFALFAVIVGYGIMFAFEAAVDLNWGIYLTGYALPFLGMMRGQALEGCEARSHDCYAGPAAGFVLGTLVLVAIYYAVGCFFGWVQRVTEEMKER